MKEEIIVTIIFILSLMIGFNIKANLGWLGTFVAIAFLLIGVLFGIGMSKDKQKNILKENRELKEILSIDVKRFMLGRKDFQERLKYLNKCMNLYRQQNG